MLTPIKIKTFANKVDTEVNKQARFIIQRLIRDQVNYAVGETVCIEAKDVIKEELDAYTS